jgi:hypothetical protein
MYIGSNFNNGFNTENINGQINVRLTPKESVFLTESINYANALVHSRNIGIIHTDTNRTVKLTPDEFIIALHSGSLPATTIVVTGSLTFNNNDINCLPSNLIIKGTLKIENCNYFTKMPLGLKVSSLSIVNCDNLTALADDIVINKELEIKNCTKFGKLQQNLTIEELAITNCDEIELSSNVKVNKKLLIVSCPKIIDLSLHCENAQYIGLSNLHNLKLDDNFFTCGTLEIYNCNINLPEDMIIGNDLILDSCNSIECLPNNIQVGGDISILNCSNIKALPSFWLTNIPHNLPFSNINNNFYGIFLENTGISAEDIDNYDQNTPYNIIVTDKLFFTRDIYELIAIWQCDADSTDEIELENIKNDDQENIRIFLCKLMETKSYENESIKKYLANKVVNILKLITTQDNLKENILLIIHDAISTCEDRVLLSLEEIEFLPLLLEAERQSITDEQGTQLKELGKQQLYANEIQVFAMIHAEKVNSGQEEIEFILSYKIQLASFFNFNFPKITMNYVRIPKLTADDIQFAKEAIETKVTDTYIEQWLNNWKPWQRHKRRWQLKKYHQLKAKRITTTELQNKGCCIISGKSIEEATDLVIYNDNIYSYKSLCQWYIRKGTDLIIPSKDIDLNNIFAVRIDESNENEFHKKAKFNDNI